MLGIGCEGIPEPETWIRIFDCYLLGDSLIDVDFKDAVSDSMVMACSRTYDDENPRRYTFSPHMINYVYSNTQVGSKLRRLIVHSKLDDRRPTGELRLRSCGLLLPRARAGV
jgi:hypothetical protein